MALPLGIGAGVGVVVIIALIMAFTGGPTSNPTPKRTTPHTTSQRPAETKKAPALASSPAKAKTAAENLARQWSAAKKYAQVNPENFAKILHRYQTVKEAAGDSPLAAEIGAAIARLEEKWDAAAQEVWAPIDAKITEAVNANDYDAALALTRQLLPKEHAPRLQPKVTERRQALTAEVTGKIDLALQQAQNASAEARPADGLKALESIAHIKYAEAAPRILLMKERLERDAGDVAQLAEQRAALEQQKKLDTFLDRFDFALLEGDNATMAGSVAREAARAEWPDALKPAVDAMGVLLKAYGDVKTKQADRLEALKGQKVTLPEGQGVIDKIVGGKLSVTISLQGGKETATKQVSLAALPASERTRLLPPFTFTTNEAHVASALGYLAKGQEDFPAATAALEKAPDFPLTPHYKEVIRRRQLGAGEQLAEQAWQDLKEAALVPLNKPIAEKLYERVLAFQNQHGATEFVKQHAAEIDALRTRVGAIAKPNLLVNGDFEGGDTNGWTITGFSKMANPIVEVTTDAAHGSKKGLLFKSSARLRQTVKLEPGKSYEFSCWVRSSGAYVRAGMLGSKTGSGFRTGTKRDFLEWTQIRIPFTATQPEHTFEVVAYNKKPFQVCFDEIQIALGSGSSIPVAASKAPADAVRFQGRAYKLFEERMSWQEAKEFCEMQGGHMVCIESEEENDFIASKFSEGRIWLGGHLTEGGWEWVNGAPYEPPVKVEETKSRGEDYLSIQDGRRWRDTPRDNRLPFICEWAAPTIGPTASLTKPVTPVPVTPVAPEPVTPTKTEPVEPTKTQPVEPKKPATVAPVTPAKVVPAAAQFFRDNIMLRGNWRGSYGSEGYAIVGGPTKLPPYAQLTIGGELFVYKEEQAKGDTRGLQLPDGTGRVNAANYVKRSKAPLVVKVNLTDGRIHPVTVYMVDYRREVGRCKVDVVDPQSGRTLATRSLRYSNGAYVSFNVRGNVEIQIGPISERRESSQNYFHICGVFFR